MRKDTTVLPEKITHVSMLVYGKRVKGTWRRYVSNVTEEGIGHIILRNLTTIHAAMIAKVLEKYT